MMVYQGHSRYQGCGNRRTSCRYRKKSGKRHRVFANPGFLSKSCGEVSHTKWNGMEQPWNGRGTEWNGRGTGVERNGTGRERGQLQAEAAEHKINVVCIHTVLQYQTYYEHMAHNRHAAATRRDGCGMAVERNGTDWNGRHRRHTTPNATHTR